jgi:HEAT repeat protein
LALDSAISALGHLDNTDAVPVILHYPDHPDETVRFAVAFALGCFPNDPQSVRGRLKLTSDANADVRDWAVFGLGVQGDADSPEIREALLQCLDDPDEDVREEAAVASEDVEINASSLRFRRCSTNTISKSESLKPRRLFWDWIEIRKSGRRRITMRHWPANSISRIN